MKKLLIAAPVVAVVAAAPYVVSQQAETRYKEEAQRFSDYLTASGLPLTMDVVEYESGFLTSKAVNRLRFADFGQENDAGGICVDLVSDIDHGYGALLQGKLLTATSTVKPLEQQSDCGLDADAEDNAEFVAFYNEHFGAEGPLNIQTDLSFSGETNVVLNMKPVEFEDDKDGDTIAMNIKPAQGTVFVAAGGSQVDVDLSWDGMTMKVSGDENFEMSVDGYSTKMSQSRLLENLWTGPVQQRVGEIKFSGLKNGQPQEFGMTEMVMDGESMVSNDKLNSKGSVVMKEFHFNGHQLGDFTMAVALNNLEVNAADRLMTFYQALNQNLMTGQMASEELTPEQEKAVVEDILTLAKEGVFNIENLEFTRAQKSLKVAGDLRMQGLDSVDMEMVQMAPMMLMANLLVNLEGTLDEELVEGLADIAANIKGQEMGMGAEEVTQMKEMMLMQFSTLAQMYTQSGMLAYDEAAKRYSSKVEMANGELLVNGMPIPLPVGG